MNKRIKKARTYDQVKYNKTQEQRINSLLPYLTDGEWQKIFNKLREDIEPYPFRTFDSNRYSSEYIRDSYCGETEYCRYTQFINGILRVIRSGEKDYCFKIEHIIDLLRFEPESLSAIWLPDDACFCVFLNIDK